MAKEYYIDEWDEWGEEHPRKRRRKKKGHKLYAFTVLLLGIFIIVLSLVVLFYVQRIEIKGNDYCKDREILEAVQNDKYSVNTLYICAKYALGYGKKIPCLDEMKVGMKLPWVLKVEVKEKPIVGYLYSGDNQYAYFDKDGLIVKKDAVYVEGVPCVEGIDVEGIELYKPIKTENKKIFEEILKASQELKKYDMAADKIVCKDNRVYVYVGQICVNLGNSVTSEKISQISPIIEKLGEKEGTLHLENYSEDRGSIAFSVGEFPEEN